ncbi:MAG: ABC transporter ATP-binding protein [Pseudomonadota bacterium]|nr:ABC transporter ATP-binding protein [Pseudomonadota bacterium]
MTVAIRVEHLAKSYTIRHENRERYVALRDVITSHFRSMWPKVMRRVRSQMPNAVERGTEEFWAVRDVSFEASAGERIGLVGRNGAGKSTLLKILSRITEPTLGRVTIHGRISSLLEVGTGFHPELTGRENIFLNGAILGMSILEMQRKFDAIVAFAEIERFLDTPVKRYSSGMYVRLAFGVAAHLDSELLLVDEVLAVGDVEFQRRCVAKMEEVTKQSGRTLLFVSHNLGLVSSLCKRIILLKDGAIQYDGPADQGLALYTSTGQLDNQPASSLATDDPRRARWARPLITGCRVVNAAGESIDAIFMGDSFGIEITFESPDNPIGRPVLEVIISSAMKGAVGGASTRMTGPSPKGHFRRGKIVCNLEGLPLLGGQYSLDVGLGDGSEDLDAVIGVLSLTIHEADVYHTGVMPFSQLGIIYFRPKWEFQLGE